MQESYSGKSRISRQRCSNGEAFCCLDRVRDGLLRSLGTFHTTKPKTVVFFNTPLQLLVVSFQGIEYRVTLVVPYDESSTMARFANVINALVQGGLVPLIVCCAIQNIGSILTESTPQAIYPTIIIVLIALNRSYTDKEFTLSAIDALPIFPIRPPVIATGPTEFMPEDSPQCSGADVLDIRYRNPGEEEASEESSLHTIVEQKMESSYVV